MTSFKLIFRNVHKNIRDYLIYFLTLTLSVSLFYAFNSISDQPAFSDMGITGSLLYDQLGILLSALSVVIAVVLAFLIIFSCSLNISITVSLILYFNYNSKVNQSQSQTANNMKEYEERRAKAGRLSRMSNTKRFL